MRHNVARLSALFLIVLSSPLASAQSPVKEESASKVPFSVVERGPHHRTWALVSEVKLRDDKVLYQTNSYTELATGLHYWKDGAWADTQEMIEIVDGVAVAQRGPHTARFAANINTAGGIELLAPDGQRFRSHVLGLFYTDYVSGRTVPLAEIKDSIGALLPPNQVIYPDAFAGDCSADVRYRYTKNGFEQDIILLTSPPSPAEWGLNPETTRLEVFTEFVEAPEAIVTSVILKEETDLVARQTMKEPDLIDQRLDFGGMIFGQGQAFPLGADADVFGDSTVQTGKSLERIGGRLILIEKVDYPAVREHLGRLPKSALINTNRKVGLPDPGRTMLASLLPPRPATASPRWLEGQYAKADPTRKGFVLDYVAVSSSSLTNYVLKGDTTYFITNSSVVNFYGTTVLEGGATVKMSTGTYLYFNGPLDCRTDTHRPAIVTSRDDDSVGESIPGSSGSPSGYYGVQPFTLKDISATYYFHDLHIRHCNYGFNLYADVRAEFRNIQVGNSGRGVAWQSRTATTWRNFLFHDLGVYGFQVNGSGTNRAEHGTLHRVAALTSYTNSTTFLFLTNCLLISVTNYPYYQGDYNATNLSDSGIFETVGAATHYLAAGSTNRNAGTTNINPTLLAELRQRTTYPPLLLTNRITASTNLAIQATRDTDTPDRGYHYDSLDYVVSGLSVSNATVTLAEGVAIGVYGASGAHGLRLEDGAVLTASGSPLNPSRISRYNCVQEQSVTNWSATSMGRSIVDASWGGSPRPSAQLRFVEFNAPAGGGGEHFEGDYSTGPDTAWFAFTHCQFHGGRIDSISANLAFTNCLFERVTLTDYSSYSDYHNCGFFGGTAYIDGGYGGHRAFQNLFDQTVIIANYVTNGYNGYVTNFNRLTSYYPNYGSNDSIVTSISYEAGVLGRFYQPSNAVVCNAGGIPAADIGLCHFTAVTNQTREGTTTVDLGFHYVALTNGVPPDYDYDGIADYLEDANGNGLGDIGETTWLHSDTDYDGRSDSDEPADGTDPLNASSVSLVRLGHWRFDDVSLAGDDGQLPDPAKKYNVVPVASWSGGALYMQATSLLRYRETETNGRPNLNCRNGTVRFWFKPDWSSVTAGGSGPQNHARLIELGGFAYDAAIGQWVLQLDPGGTNIYFGSQSNGVAAAYWRAPVSLVAGHWYQIALSYSPSNTALFLNGQLQTNAAVSSWEDRPSVIATSATLNTVGGGIYDYPSASIRATGFRIGNDWGDGQQAQGQFEELETFNYPLTSRQIAAGFPGFYGAVGVTNDLDYDGRSDILEYQADGTTTNSASSVAGGRLGYWRFNGATNNLLGEAMQAPLVVSGVSVTPGWSSNALVIPDGSTARVAYRDVETNGWANFNARAGAVRFWFRPNWSWDGTGTDGSFLFLGHPTSETSGRWDFGIKGPGKKIWLRTSTNGASTTLFESSFDFISNRWCQIALNYGSSSVALYMNGTLITNVAAGITQWPSLADRANGLVIGNNHAGTRPVNGRFDEVETFNRPLTEAEIQRSFNSVNSLDSDLNGVPDLLEDIALTSSRPFVGVPFVITGTIEAEQFDAGGKGIAYTNVANNVWTNDYRASGMEITNCNDLGGGYLVNNLKAGDWMKYTLDVKVAQTYAIEPRVAGLGTGGVFHIQFFTNGNSAPYATTGPLTVTTTNWTNITYKMVSLAAGTNVMKVLMTNNASGGYVGKLNYISVYPAWNEWSPTNGMTTNDLTGVLSTNETWSDAVINTYTLQAAIDWLPNGGVVTIPSGTFYLTHQSPDESRPAYDNAALLVGANNISIQGAGRNLTRLIAFNRTTSIVFTGRNSDQEVSSITNFQLANLTVESRPHLVPVLDTATGDYTNRWEEGSLWPIGENHTGELIVSEGKSSANRNINLLFTNCLFRNFASVAVRLSYNNSNVAVRACDFIMWDGTNGSFSISTTQPMLTTSNLPPTAVGVHVRAGACPNIVMTECVFNGNPSLTAVNTNYAILAGDGIFYGQGPGNWFIARNAITNYGLEGVQVNAGPSAVVGNTFDTFVSLFSTCAVNGFGLWPTVTGLNNDAVIWFVGNEVHGGRYGELGHSQAKPFHLHFTGNTVGVYAPFEIANDYPGAAVLGTAMTFANVSGNRLVSGGHGVHWGSGCSNAVVLKNDFSAAAYRGLNYDGTNGVANAMAISKNLLGQGVGVHLRLRESDAGGFFLWQNRFTNGVTTVNPFTDSANAPVHYVH